MIRAAILALFLAGCATPSQCCVGHCTQTNPVEHVTR